MEFVSDLIKARAELTKNIELLQNILYKEGAENQLSKLLSLIEAIDQKIIKILQE